MIRIDFELEILDGFGKPQTIEDILGKNRNTRVQVSALQALMKDFKEISDSPLELISAQPLEENFLTWHCNLKGPDDSPYEGGIFHIELKFTQHFPSVPPSATLLTPVPHPHVNKLGNICLDILGDYQSYFSSMEKTSIGGWRSAYSVRTILIQLQSQFEIYLIFQHF